MTSQAMTNNLWTWIDEEPEPEPIETIDPRMAGKIGRASCRERV